MPVLVRPLVHLLSALVMTAPVVAQTTCAPGQTQAAIDAYASEPFGPRMWRKITGLGDPDIEALSFDSANYAASEEWRKLAAVVLPGSEAFGNPSYACRLEYPLNILKARIAKFGASSDYVKQWALGQESVIRSCGSGAEVPVPVMVPPPGLKPDEVSLLSHDRAYQEASVLFYAKPVAAVQAFRAIAATPSPHAAAARYNVANLLANAKDIAAARREAEDILKTPALSSVHGITRDLVGYIANQEDTPSGWLAMIDQKMAVINTPQAKLDGNSTLQTELARAYYDVAYAGITAKRDDWWITNTLPENPTLSKALADSARKHPLAMWMMAGQSVHKPMTQAPWAAIGPKWQAWATSYVDRAQALQATALPVLAKQTLDSLKAATDDASRSALWSQSLAAAARATSTCGAADETGALALLASQAMRVSAQAGRYDEIYANTAKLGLEGSKTFRDTLLPKLLEHVLAQGDVEEGRRMRDAFVTLALMESFSKDELWQRSDYEQFLSWVAEDETQWIEAVALSSQKLSPAVLNLLPASKLRELADNPIFNAQQKALLKRAAWTRNFARGVRNSDKTTADMLAANPEIAASLAAVKSQYPKLNGEQAMALTMLRNPRFGILLNSPGYSDPIETARTNFAEIDNFDPNDKNWWCPLEPDRQVGLLRQRYDESSGLQPAIEGYAGAAKDLLEADALTKAATARDLVLKQHPMVKAINWKEVASLAKAPSAPKLMTRSAINLAKRTKSDDGAAAEALALAVRSTRYGCRWHGSHETYSKPAQEMLKAKFASTAWATQTPYWFGCMDRQYDAEGKIVADCKPRVWPKQKALK